MHKLLGKSFDWIVIPSVAICMTLWPALSTGLERMPVYPGDTLLNVYFLEHAFQHLTEGNLLNPDKFWSPNYFWPIEGVLAWSDHLLGQSILYGLFRPFFDKFESYTVWLGLTLWLNYISIRIAAQKISPQTNKSWLSIAALATTFSPAILQQLSHPQLLSLYFIGPILILNHKLINKEVNHFTLSDWFFLGSCVLANGFFNIYIFVYACYGTLVCAIIHIIKRFFIGENYLKKGEHILLAFSSLVVSIS